MKDESASSLGLWAHLIRPIYVSVYELAIVSIYDCACVYTYVCILVCVSEYMHIQACICVCASRCVCVCVLAQSTHWWTLMRRENFLFGIDEKVQGSKQTNHIL